MDTAAVKPATILDWAANPIQDPDYIADLIRRVQPVMAWFAGYKVPRSNLRALLAKVVRRGKGESVSDVMKTLFTLGLIRYRGPHVLVPIIWINPDLVLTLIKSAYGGDNNGKTR